MGDFDKSKFKVISTPDQAVSDFDPSKFKPIAEPKQEGYNQKTEEIINNIPDLSDGQKDLVKNLAKKGASSEEISNSILTLQGKHPIQSAIGKVEGNDDFRAFADVITLGKAQPKYYVEDDGRVIPLAKGVEAPEGKKISNVWGAKGDTKDDSKLTTLAKNVWNIMPGVVENAADLVHLPYVLGQTSETWIDKEGNFHTWKPQEADWYKDFKNKIKSVQAETGDKYNTPLIKSENINKFSDLFEAKNYDINPDNVVGTIGSLVKSVGEFGLSGAGIGSIANATSSGAKLATGFTASYMTQLGDVIDAGKQAGLDTEDAYALASAITVPLALVDVNMGVEGRILSDAMAKEQKSALIKNLTKDIVKDSEGKITKEVLDDAFKATIVANTALAKTWTKETAQDVFGEAGQEALQGFIQNAGEQIYDKLSDNPKFGTDAFSAQSFAGYLNDAIAGALGGLPTAAAYNRIKRTAKEDEQSKSVMGVIEKGPEAIQNFKANIDAALQSGDITPAEAETAKFKVDAYDNYNKQIGTTLVKPEDKRRVFDLSFQKQTLDSEIEGIKKEELDPIELAKFEAKQKQSKDIQNEINKIVLSADVKEESVLADKTKEDVIKHEEKQAEKRDLEKMRQDYKEETGYLPPPTKQEREENVKAGLLEDTRKMLEIDPFEFNQEKGKGQLGYNHRLKFKQVSEHIDSTPEGKETGVLRVIKTKTKNKEGKYVPNTIISVELPSGHQIRTASSMVREEGNFRGHFREEHLPKGKKVSDSQVDSAIEGFPVGMKIVKTTPGVSGEHTAIKIYNLKTGKFVSWAKATTKGQDALSQKIVTADEKFKNPNSGITKQEYDGEVKRREDMAREESVIETPTDLGGETEGPLEPTKPVKPTKGPKSTIKTRDEFISSGIDQIKKEGDYNPELENVYKQVLGKQYDKAQGEVSTTPVTDAVAERIIEKPKKQKKEKPVGIVRALLKSPPQTFEDAVLQFFLKGGRITPGDFIRYTGFKGKESQGYIWAKKGDAKPIDLLVRELWGEELGMDMEDIDELDLISEFFDILTSHSGKASMIRKLADNQKEEIKSENEEGVPDYILQYAKDVDDFFLGQERELTDEEIAQALSEEEARSQYEEQKGDEEEYQKIKSPKPVFEKAMDMYSKLKTTEGALKKRKIKNKRVSLLKENPSVKFIDDNAPKILDQLQNKGIITKEGDCP